jgi:tetratricopeptide (TPR) repeat protein
VARVSARTRTFAIVGAAAAAAAAVAAGVVVIGADSDDARPESSRPKSAPPLLLDLGVRSDAEARQLRAAASAYAHGRRLEAGRAFGRFRSLPARVGSAMADWPSGAEQRLRALEDANPRSALVLLHLGLVTAWDDRLPEAQRTWRRALRVDPDSLSAVRAEDFLFLGRFPPGRPVFTPGSELPERIRALPRERQLAALAAGARGDATLGLVYGSALQQLGRPVSALGAYRRAERQATGDLRLEAQVAVAVAQFTKAQPELAFGRLGPLARDHPRSPSVRFHLGLLLAWLGRADEATRQLRLAVEAGPRTRPGREARRFLSRLEGIRTG